LIDPWGRVVAEIPLDAEDILDISLPVSRPPTFYYNFGSWVDLLAVIVTLLGWFACTISTGRPSLPG
jgi:apolipoprotein N-acyltransferase